MGESWSISGILPVAASITMKLLRSHSNTSAGVELDDAAEQVVGSLWEDTIHHRRLCGEGDLNPPAFIEAVQAAGYRGYYGVEILSEKHRKLPLDGDGATFFRDDDGAIQEARPQSGEGGQANQECPASTHAIG